MKEAVGKDEVLEYEVKSLREQVDTLKKHKDVNKALRAELAKVYSRHIVSALTDTIRIAK